jgi:hypothetical protein
MARIAVIIAMIALVTMITLMTGCTAGFSGEYEEVEGAGSMEFKTDGTVYIETMGMTSQAEYEVDGKRVIIRTQLGSQVFTREGDLLKGGDGVLSATYKRKG